MTLNDVCVRIGCTPKQASEILEIGRELSRQSLVSALGLGHEPTDVATMFSHLDSLPAILRDAANRIEKSCRILRTIEHKARVRIRETKCVKSARWNGRSREWRPTIITRKDEIRDLHERGMSIREISERLGCSYHTIYGLLNTRKANSAESQAQA